MVFENEILTRIIWIDQRKRSIGGEIFHYRAMQPLIQDRSLEYNQEKGNEGQKQGRKNLPIFLEKQLEIFFSKIKRITTKESNEYATVKTLRNKSLSGTKNKGMTERKMNKQSERKYEIEILYQMFLCLNFKKSKSSKPTPAIPRKKTLPQTEYSKNPKIICIRLY